MKQLIVVLCQITPIKSQLDKIKLADTDYVLVINKNIASKISDEDREFFQKIHTVREIDFVTLSLILQPYSRQYDFSASAILTSDETCTLVAAKARDHFSIPGSGYKDVIGFVDKDIMKQQLADTDVRLPKYLLFDKQRYQQLKQGYLSQVIERIDFPIFVKPLDQCGGHGICRIEEMRAFEEWAESVVDDSLTYEVDEYIAGSLYHCDAATQDGQIIYFSASRYSCPVEDFSKGALLGSILIPKTENIWKRLFQFNRNVLKIMNAPDGVTHLEVFETAKGELIFLEVAARPPGAFTTQIHEKNSGINYETLHFRLLLGLPVNTTETINNDTYTWAFIPKKSGTIKKLNTPEINSQFDIDWKVSVGDDSKQGKDILDASNIAGMITYHNASYEKLYGDFEKLRNFKAIETY